MSEATKIDWTKPIEGTNDDGVTWCPARVICDNLDHCQYKFVVAIKPAVSEFARHVMPNGQGESNWQFRNVPPPPVPFEFTRWVNVYRNQDGSYWEGGSYGCKEVAEGNRFGHGVTVPIAIRGEWKQD